MLHSISFLLLLRILGRFSGATVMPPFCDIAKNLPVLAILLVILCCRTVSLWPCAILSLGSCKESAGVVIALRLCCNDYIPFLCALLQNACILDPLECSLALLITYAGIVGFRLWCPWPSCELTILWFSGIVIISRVLCWMCTWLSWYHSHCTVKE